MSEPTDPGNNHQQRPPEPGLPTEPPAGRAAAGGPVGAGSRRLPYLPVASGTLPAGQGADRIPYPPYDPGTGQSTYPAPSGAGETEGRGAGLTMRTGAVHAGRLIGSAVRALQLAPGCLILPGAVVGALQLMVAGTIWYRGQAAAILDFEALFSSQTAGSNLVAWSDQWLWPMIGTMVLAAAAAIPVGALAAIGATRALRGERTTLLGALSELRSRIRPVGSLALAALAAAAAVSIVTTAPMLFASSSQGALSAILTLVQVFSTVLAPVAIGFLVVRLTAAVPIVALESVTAFEAVREAWRLTRGQFWRLAGLYALAGAMVAAVGALAQGPASALLGAFAGNSPVLLASPVILALTLIPGGALTGAASAVGFAGTTAIFCAEQRGGVRA